MDNQKRVIQINPELFKVNAKTRKSRARKKSTEDGGESGTSSAAAEKKINSKTLKKKLLQKMRQSQRYDEKMGGGGDGYGSDDEFGGGGGASDFENSMRYFENLRKNTIIEDSPATTEQVRLKNVTRKNRYNHGGGGGFAAATDEYVNLQMPQEFQLTQTPQEFNPLELKPAPYIENPLALPPPKYGCLKNGSLPTLRTLKNRYEYTNYGSGNEAPAAYPYYSPPPTMPEEYNAPPPIYKEQLRNHLYEKEIADAAETDYFFEPEPTKHRKTIKRTYEVGKSKIHPKVSVLISNKTIRKRILNDTMKYTQTPIHEVKKYLQRKGLIKVGSAAPNNILRKMYESAMLTGGDIVNHNKETLLYNFLNEEKH